MEYTVSSYNRNAFFRHIAPNSQQNLRPILSSDVDSTEKRFLLARTHPCFFVN